MRAKIMYFSLAVALVIIFLFLFKRHEVPAALVCSAKNHLVLNTQKQVCTSKGRYCWFSGYHLLKRGYCHKWA